jgi:hypothetical protein
MKKVKFNVVTVNEQYDDELNEEVRTERTRIFTDISKAWDYYRKKIEDMEKTGELDEAYYDIKDVIMSSYRKDSYREETREYAMSDDSWSVLKLEIRVVNG